MPKTNAAPPTGKLPEKTDFVRLGMLGIFALALLLRIYGIGWALPNAQRWFSYHTDESMVTVASLALDPLHGHFDPHFYNYGSLDLLLNAWVIQIGHAIGLIVSGPASGVPSASELLCARLVTVALGTLTCGLIFGIGRLLYGRAAGMTAAGLYAVAPLAVQHSHWATVDVPATFFITGALYFAARRVSPETRRFDLLWCGLFAGFAAATKYNAGIALLAGFAALAVVKLRRTVPELSGLVAAALVGFVWGCPAIVLNPAALLKNGLLYEANHVAHGQDAAFLQTGSGFGFHLWNLECGLTLPVLLLAGIGLAWAVRQRKPGDWVLLAFVVPYYCLIGLAQIKFARYTIPLFPPLLLLAGRALTDAELLKRPAFRYFAVTAGTFSAAAALFYALAFDNAMVQTDTRDRAAVFLRQKGVNSVGFGSGPWFFSPPLGPLFTAPVPTAAKASAANVAHPTLFTANEDWDRDLLAKNSIDAVAVSEYEWRDPQRLHDPHTAAFVAALNQDYPRRTVFAQPMEVFGILIANAPSGEMGLPTQNLPYDMLYTNPTTIVYSK